MVDLYPETLLNIITAFIILIAGLVIGRILSNLIKGILKRLKTDKILRGELGIKVPLERSIASIIKYLVYFAALIMALSQLGVSTTALQIILIVLLALVVIFAILAFKDLIPNIISGFFLHATKTFKPGDIIQVKNIKGKVLNISLIETKISTKEGDIVFIPNSILTKSEIIKLKRKKEK